MYGSIPSVCSAIHIRGVGYLYCLGLLADGDGMSRGGGSRKGFLVWLEDMIDVSMKHAPATTRMLLERKLAEPVMVPKGTETGPVKVPIGTENGD